MAIFSKLTLFRNCTAWLGSRFLDSFEATSLKASLFKLSWCFFATSSIASSSGNDFVICSRNSSVIMSSCGLHARILSCNSSYSFSSLMDLMDFSRIAENEIYIFIQFWGLLLPYEGRHSPNIVKYQTKTIMYLLFIIYILAFGVPSSGVRSSSYLLCIYGEFLVFLLLWGLCDYQYKQWLFH